MISTDTQTRFSDYIAASVQRVAPTIFGGAACLALFFGWMRSDEEYFTPKNGPGYWLGIFGATLMLLMLVYSYRKRRRKALVPGSIPTWFRIHMILGVVAPILILYHSNFRLGALNSNVALFSMLTVMASGIAGRYIYGKVHRGLGVRRSVVQEIFTDVEKLREEFGPDLDGMDSLIVALNAFGRDVIEQPPRTAFEGFYKGGTLAVRSRLLRGQVRKEVHKIVHERARYVGWSRSEARKRAAASETKICAYFNAVLNAMELQFYERLFALWHLLHLPLFFLMITAGLVHVWAVHRY